MLFLYSIHGGLAQLARALALQARGHRFDSDILHQTRQSLNTKKKIQYIFVSGVAGFVIEKEKSNA